MKCIASIINLFRMWKRAVWLEGKKEEEGVIPCTWVVEDKKIVYWPSKINAQNALNKREDPDPNSWRKFPLLKVKIVSSKYIYIYTIACKNAGVCLTVFT